jgi:hypothetical protein
MSAAAVLFLVPLSTAVINGELLPSNAQPEVVQLVTDGYGCSAVLVSPRALLTAAHCVKAERGTFVHGGRRYDVRLFKSGGYRDRGHDLAIGVADRDVVGASTIPLDPTVGAGDEIQLVGFGCDQPGGGGRRGTLRAGRSQISRIKRSFLLVARLAGGAAVCFGDSGGPAFTLKDGARRLAGIIARGNIKSVSYVISLSAPESRELLAWADAEFALNLRALTPAD